MSAYFISDLHLTGADDPNVHRLLCFLKQIAVPETTHLFLVGDIFDLWIADHRHFIDKFQSIVDQLRAMRDLGIEIHYFEGNHDLYLRHFWQNKLGMQVHSGPAVFKLGKFTVRVEHGDQMDPEDKGYLFLRWFLRTPLMKFIALHLPESLVVKIGEKASHTSRDYTSNTKTISHNNAIEKIRQHADKIYAHEPFDYFVAGHVHIKDDYQMRGGSRAINLGSWLSEPIAYQLSEQGGQWRDI
jgi:UDP-2,3-diacylglucosamine hydrolase